MSDAVEASGRTVEEAIDRALQMLGASDDEVEIQVLSEGGGFTARDREARVRARLRDERTPEDLALLEDEDAPEGDEVPEDEDPDLEEQAEAAEGFLRGFLATIGLEAQVLASRGRDAAVVELTGPELGLLIGRRGSTLEALQEVTRAAVQRDLGRRAWVNLDIEGYRARRRQMLERRAKSVAAKVRRSGRPQELEPMTPFERKVVHDALGGFPGVRTASEGDEPNRFVVVLPE